MYTILVNGAYIGTEIIFYRLAKFKRFEAEFLASQIRSMGASINPEKKNSIRVSHISEFDGTRQILSVKKALELDPDSYRLHRYFLNA